jgi:hypothetical protein
VLINRRTEPRRPSLPAKFPPREIGLLFRLASERKPPVVRKYRQDGIAKGANP